MPDIPPPVEDTAPPAPAPDGTPPDVPPDVGTPNGPVTQEPPPEHPGTTGDCGESRRQRLVEGEKGWLDAASPGARTLVFTQPDGSMHVRDTSSGRITSLGVDLRADFLGFTRDERRALFWAQDDGPSGTFLEVDASTGTVRAPVGTSASRHGIRRGLDGWFLRASDGRVWSYDHDSAAPWLVASPLGPEFLFVSSPSSGRVLLLDPDEAVLVELASRKSWRIAPSKAAYFIPDGSGVMYVDDQNQVWGWTPRAARVLLGQSTRPIHSVYLSWPGDVAWSTGELLFVGTDGRATLWNPHTNAVRAVGTDVVSGQLSDSGTRLVLVHRTPEGTYSVTARELPAGTERTLWRGEQLPEVSLTGSGTWLFLSTPFIPVGGNPEIPYFQSSIWNLGVGTEFVLNPPLAAGRYGPAVSFREDLRLIHVAIWDGDERMYSMEDGSLRYRTTRTIAMAEGIYSYWGPGGIFYGWAGAYMGPPDGGLFAWDSRTGVETELGTGTAAVCFFGERHLFRQEVPWFEEGRPGALTLWTPSTGAFETLSARANQPWCAPRRPQVVFLETGKDESRGDLVIADVDRHCRQPLGAQVKRFLVQDEAILFQSAGEVWRVSYPKQ